MTDLRVQNKRRIMAGIIGIMMLFVVMLSAFYIALESGHHCEDEDCPICICIQQCENTLHQLGGVAIIQIAIIIPVVLNLVLAIRYYARLKQDTLVSQKIRLNN